MKTKLLIWALVFILLCSFASAQLILVDDFEDGIINTNLWTMVGIQAAECTGVATSYWNETNGQLRLGICVTTEGTKTASATLKKDYNRRNATINLETQHMTEIAGAGYWDIREHDFRITNGTNDITIIDSWDWAADSVWLLMNYSIRIYDNDTVIVYNTTNGNNNILSTTDISSLGDTPKRLYVFISGAKNSGGGKLKMRLYFVEDNYPINLTILGQDRFDNTIINNFTAIIEGIGSYNTTNGQIITNETINSSRLYNITISADQGQYFNITYLDQNMTYILYSNQYESIAGMTSKEMITNNSIQNFSIVAGGKSYTTTNGTITIYPRREVFYLNFTSNAGYYNQTDLSFNQTPYTEKNWTITAYTSLLNITAENLINGSPVTSFTVNLSSNDYTYTTTGNTTGGYVEFGLLNGSYSVTIDAEGYALPGGTTINVTAGYNNVTLGLYTENSISFTFKDGSTRAVIDDRNTSVELISDLASYNYTTPNGTLYVDLLVPSNYTIRYSANAYHESFYYFTLVDRTTNSLTLYMMSNSTAEEVTANVYDEGNHPLENAYIKVLRYNVDSNSYELQEIMKTNFEGQTKLHLTLNDEFYKFIIEYPYGTVRKETSPTYIYATTLNFQISLGADIAEKFYQSQDITYSLIFNNDTNNFRFTYSDGNNVVSQACLEVYKITIMGETAYNSTCASGAAGSLLVGVANISGTTYKADAFYSASARYFLTSFIKTFEVVSPAGKLGVLMIALLTMVFAFIGYWDKSIALIITPIPLFLGSLLNLIDLPLSITLPIQIVCIIVAIWISKKG